MANPTISPALPAWHLPGAPRPERPVTTGSPRFSPVLPADLPTNLPAALKGAGRRGDSGAVLRTTHETPRQHPHDNARRDTHNRQTFDLSHARGEQPERGAR